MKRIWKVLPALAAAGIVSTGGVVYAQSNIAEPPTFGVTPDVGSGAPAPEYSAVADQDGSIAGYVHTAVFESTGPAPATPEEALEQAGTATGNLYEVFDPSGAIVGYFASEGHGFVDSAAKDALVADGFQLFEAPTPGSGSPVRPVESVDVVSPSTTEAP